MDSQTRTEIETIAFTINGIVGVCDSINQAGQPILKILLSQPLANLSLPPQLIRDDIEFEYIDSVDALS